MPSTSESIADARRQIHEIVRKDVPFDEKARDVLELASQCLDTEQGFLIHTDQETDHWEAEITTNGADGHASPEIERDLQETYCRETIEDDVQHALHDAPNQGWADDPAFEISQQHTYLGTPLILDENPYGTVCFVAEDPQSEPFSEPEMRFAEHVTRLLERELERNQVEAQLTKQTNLATVLNRVLRHNLRNDASVIRGYTELMADQLNDNGTAETILKHIDDLIHLSDKARELEKVILASSERRQTEIGSLIEDTVERIAHEHQTATISVECDDDIHAEVLPNFDRALEELIENALKHSGDHPTVTIDIEVVPNAVEIRIQDNGPGLPDSEAKVLTEGEESPLTHGSGLGLWLAHWIINSHDGSIEPVVTEHGTTMVISLPRTSSVGTQQQLTELSRSRDKYKASFDNAKDAVTLLNDDGRIMDANSTAGDVFGIDVQDELLGRHITEFLSDEFEFETEWQKLVQDSSELDTVTVRGADGVERVLDYSASTNVVPGQHLFISRDVTEQKQREREIETAKERYETLLTAAPNPVFVADTETEEIIEVNEAAEALLGRSSDEVVGRHFSEFHPADQSEQYWQLFEDLVDTGGTARQLPDGTQIVMVTDDGEQIPVKISVDTVSLPEKSVIFGIYRDISEQVERERELRVKTRAMEKAPIGITLTDPEQDDNPMVYTNERFCELSGYDEDDILGRNCRFMQGENTDSERVAQIREAVDAQEEIAIDLRNYRKDGTEFWNRLEIAPVRNDEGEVINYMGFQQDVTERKEHERRLYKTIADQAEEGVFVFDSAQNLVEANESAREYLSQTDDFARLTANEPMSVKSKTVFDSLLATVEERERLETAIDIVSDGEGPVTLKLTLGTGELVRCECSRVGGETARTLVVLHELVESQKPELETGEETSDDMERERDLYLRTLENITDTVVITDDTGEFTWVCPNVHFIFGYSATEITQNGGIESLFDGGAPVTSEDFEPDSVVEEVEATVTTRTGEKRDVLVTARRVSIGDGTILYVLSDITERKERERELAEKTRQLEAIVQNTSEAIYIKDSEGCYQFINESGAELLGYTPEEIIGRHDEELFDTEREADVEAVDTQVIESGEEISEETVRYIDGEKHVFLDNKYPYRDEDGEIIGLIGISPDITERKQYKEQLEATKERYETLLEAAPEPVFVSDGETGEIIEINEAAATLLGEPREQIVGRHIVSLHPEEDAELYRDAFDRIEGERTTIRTLPDSSRPELETDDETIPIEISAGTVSLPDGVAIFGIFRDVTNRHVEEQRTNLKRLNQVLRHDVRNDLQVVSTYTGILEQEIDGEEETEYLQAITESVEDAIKLTDTAGNLADVILEPHVGADSIQLNAVIREEIDAAKEINTNADIQVDGSLPTTAVQADELLNSVFRNLLTNAIQHNDNAQPEITLCAEELDGTVRVRVADNGPGVPDARKEDIFGRGEKGLDSPGTGLGLYLVDALVDSYGGDVWVEDNDPTGPVFIVELPVSE